VNLDVRKAVRQDVHQEKVVLDVGDKGGVAREQRSSAKRVALPEWLGSSIAWNESVYGGPTESCWRTMQYRHSSRLSSTNGFCGDGESSPLCSRLCISDELSDWWTSTKPAGVRYSSISTIVEMSKDRGRPRYVPVRQGLVGDAGMSSETDVIRTLRFGQKACTYPQAEAPARSRARSGAPARGATPPATDAGRSPQLWLPTLPAHLLEERRDRRKLRVRIRVAR
jgi:hypothetical protein